MKKIKFIFSLIVGILTSAIIGTIIADYLNVNPFIPSAGLFLSPLAIKLSVRAYLGFLPRQANFAYFAVQKETWVDYIMGNLFKDNEFLKYCYDESEHVLNGVVVHIPQAGTKVSVKKNRSMLPAAVVQRTDADITYTLDYFTSDPRLITNAEDKELSYSKIESVIGEDVATLGDTVADDILFKWCPNLAANIIRTTGVADAVALATGATGTRKAVLGADLRKAQAKMNKANVSKTDRYALFDDDMLTQLMADASLTNAQLQLLVDAKEGKIQRLFGFNILTRSTVATYDNAGTPVPKSIDAAAATTDNLAVLCWQKHAVAKAMNAKPEFFENKQDATFYGDVYSAGQRAGARIRKSDQLGVIAIVQIP